MASDKYCYPLNWEGLGLNNKALLAKLTWKFTTHDSFVFSFLRAWYMRKINTNFYAFSFIWSAMCKLYGILSDERCWLIGKHFKDTLLQDNWVGVPL